MIVNPGIRRFLGSAIQRLFNSASVSLPLTHTAIPTRGDITPSFTRATTATGQKWDEAGYLDFTALAGEAVFKGARREYNQWTTSSVTLASGGNKSLTLTAGTYQFSMGAGTGTATFSGTGGATGTLAASTGRVSVAKTITAGTFVVTASVADLADLQVCNITGETDQTTIRPYVSVGAVQRNYVFYSNNPVYWGVVSNVTVTPNQLANPVNGALDAWKVAATAAGVTNLNTPLGVTALATEATASFYAHKGSGATDANKFALYNDSTASILSLVSIDYDTGVLTTIVGVAGTSTDAGNGWWRISLSATSGITVGNQLRVYACFTGNAETAGEYAYLYGTQGEFESAATSYQDVGNVPAYHGSMVDGVKCYDTDRSGNPISTTGSYPLVGYVPWEARTNSLLQANAFTTTWSTLNTPTLTQNAVGPNGAAGYAWTVTDNDAASFEGISQTGVAWGAGFDGCVSFLVGKKVSSPAYPIIQFYYNVAALASHRLIINEVDGTVVAGGTTTPTRYGIESYNANFWLVWIAGTQEGATVNARVDVFPAGSLDGSTVSAAAVGSTVFCDGRFESGKAAPSPYIPTTTVAVARNADMLTYTGADVANIKTLACTFSRGVGVSSVGVAAVLTDGTNAEAINLYLNDATSMRCNGTDNNVTQWAVIASNAYTPGTDAKVSVSFVANDVKTDFNGTAGTQDTSATLPTFTQLQIGFQNTAFTFNGPVNHIYGWTRNLSQSEVGAVDR